MLEIRQLLTLRKLKLKIEIGCYKEYANYRDKNY